MAGIPALQPYTGHPLPQAQRTLDPGVTCMAVHAVCFPVTLTSTIEGQLCPAWAAGDPTLFADSLPSSPMSAESTSLSSCVANCKASKHEQALHPCVFPGSAAAAVGAKRKRKPAAKPSRAQGVGGPGSAPRDQAGAEGDQERTRLQSTPLQGVAASGGCRDHVWLQTPQVGSTS